MHVSVTFRHMVSCLLLQIIVHREKFRTNGLGFSVSHSFNFTAPCKAYVQQRPEQCFLTEIKYSCCQSCSRIPQEHLLQVLSSRESNVGVTCIGILTKRITHSPISGLWKLFRNFRNFRIRRYGICLYEVLKENNITKVRPNRGLTLVRLWKKIICWLV